MDVTSITAAYASLKAMKELGAAALSAKIDAEAKEKITEVIARASDIQEALFWVREELLKQQEENRLLREQITDFEKSRVQEENVVWERPYYFLRAGDDKDGPFCQNCWDADKKLIRLQEQMRGSWYCHCCKGSVTDSSYSPPRVNRSHSSYI